MAARRGKRPTPLDPRVERSRRVILLAALDELGEAGYGTFNIESVAQRAGVGKATIYRHWRHKLALIADAFRMLQDEGDPELATGTPREKLERVVRHVAEVAKHSAFSKCLPALIDAAERDPEMRTFHRRFQAEARRPLIALLEQGVESGDFPRHVDPELTAFSLLGAIFFCRLMTSKPFDPDRAPDLIHAVLGTRGPRS